MIQWEPGIAPPTYQPGWLNRVLNDLKAATNLSQDNIIFRTLFSAPEKVSDGMVLKVDGSSYNPGLGAGFYYYNESTGSLVKFLTFSDVIGYPTGAGGTVTQTGNKGTAVTLNKPCGQVTMDSAALASGAVVAFTINNTLITTSDCVLVQLVDGTSLAYELMVQSMAAGSCVVRLTNISAGSLSEAVKFNFVVIKGATA